MTRRLQSTTYGHPQAGRKALTENPPRARAAEAEIEERACERRRLRREEWDPQTLRPGHHGGQRAANSTTIRMLSDAHV